MITLSLHCTSLFSPDLTADSVRAESLGEILTEVPVVVVGRPEPPPVVVVVVLVAGFSNLIGRELQSVAGASNLTP